MFLNTMSLYLSGVTNMASLCTPGANPSFIEADCFEKGSHLKEFAKYYEIPQDAVAFRKSRNSLRTILGGWLFDTEGKVTDNLLILIEQNLGKVLCVYEPRDNSKLCSCLSRCEGGISPFYFAEDIMLAEFEKYAVFFSIGNNE